MDHLWVALGAFVVMIVAFLMWRLLEEIKFNECLRFRNRYMEDKLKEMGVMLEFGDEAKGTSRD